MATQLINAREEKSNILLLKKDGKLPLNIVFERSVRDEKNPESTVPCSPLKYPRSNRATAKQPTVIHEAKENTGVYTVFTIGSPEDFNLPNTVSVNCLLGSSNGISFVSCLIKASNALSFSVLIICYIFI